MQRNLNVIKSQRNRLNRNIKEEGDGKRGLRMGMIRIEESSGVVERDCKG